MAQNFKAWSVTDKNGDFIVAILVEPDVAAPPEIPEQFRRRAPGGIVKLVDGLPPDSWRRWIGNHWQARPGRQPEATGGED